MGFRSIALLSTLSLLAACERSHPRRTWRPEEHTQPPASQETPAEEAPSAEAPNVPPEEARASAAAALYRIKCAACHGAEGHGDGPSRAPVMQIPDFAAAEFQSSRSDEQLAESIARGRGMMPPFGNEIAPDGIVALVEHVRRLGGAR